MALKHNNLAERESITTTSALDLINGDTSRMRELRSADNHYGYRFERYEHLVFGDECIENLEKFSKDAIKLVGDEKLNTPALQLATLTTCLDLSQAIIRVSERFSTTYPPTALTMDSLDQTIGLMRDVVDAVHPSAALAEIVKEKIEWIFETYRDHPTLEVDVPMRNYETDVLGSVVLLEREGVGDIEEALRNRIENGTPFGPIEGQPTQFAKGMIGFRDTVDHIALALPIDQADIERRAGHSYEDYVEMSIEQQDYLSGIYDYEQAIDRSSRELVVTGAKPLEEIFSSDPGRLALFQEMHRPIVRAIVENSMGISLKDVPLENQFEFLRFCIERGRDDFNRLSGAMLDASSDIRPRIFEAFLATEFGDDFGETILDIVENISPEETEHIFSTINELRRGAEEFSERFSQIDPGLAKSTRLALNQRITDSLVALREIAVKGVLDENVAPHRDDPDYNYGGKFDVKLRSIEEAMRIIDGLKNTFDAISSILDADDMKVSCLNEDRSRFSVYRLVSNDAGNMIVYIRTEGAYGYDEGIEYGNGRGVEASINFKVNPLNPHKLLMPKSKEAVSIRFDREGRRVDEDSDSENRDPTREDGLIAVDISSVMGDPKSLPVQIGRLIAAGNRIRSRERGTKDSLHHNTNFLDQEKYGSAGGFSDLARELIVHFDMLREATRRRKFGKRVFSATAGDSESLKSVA